MIEIKRFGVLSVGIMWGILSAIGGLIGGIFMLIMTATIPMYDIAYEEIGFLGWFFGGMALIALPIFYGVAGFIGGIITAALYNLFQKWVGGVKIEFQQETDLSQ